MDKSKFLNSLRNKNIFFDILKDVRDFL